MQPKINASADANQIGALPNALCISQNASHAAKEPHVPGAGVMQPDPKNVEIISQG